MRPTMRDALGRFHSKLYDAWDSKLLSTDDHLAVWRLMWLMRKLWA